MNGSGINFEGRNFEGRNSELDASFGYVTDIMGKPWAERLSAMREMVRNAEQGQQNFILRVAEPLDAAGRELLKRAKDYIGQFYEKGFNQLAAIMRGDQGTEVSGLQFDSKIGEASYCAERRALLNFVRTRKQGERVMVTATARSGEISAGKFTYQYTESVGPCALCRDALHSFNEQAQVIQPVGEEVKIVPVWALYPSGKFLWGQNDQNKTQKEYRQLLLEISEQFPLSEEDREMILQAGSVLQTGRLRDSENRIVVMATGFSGKFYTSSMPQFARNSQSLIIDRPVELQVVCDASENRDQLSTLAILTVSQETDPEVILPVGVSRELIRQFHPLTTVVVDFGKEGLRKLPIEILYPLVYKLRRRKNAN